MYRQVLMNPEHCPLQRIVWRDNPEMNFSIYELKTVTYGTAAAPYLAIKCLNQLAIENANYYSEAAKIILNDFYVDDLLTGSNDLTSLTRLCHEISTILNSGNFVLRKWISNQPQIISNFTNSNISNDVLLLGEHDSIKTLGIQWLSKADLLKYSIQSIKDNDNFKSVTKRQVLSYIAHIYDPLGLLSPCVISSKIIIQKLWSLKLAWDDPIPNDIFNGWKQYQLQLKSLNQLRIPRNVTCYQGIIQDIHCFCDASKDAYAACVYVRSSSQNGEYHINLLCAKTKVAPIKSISIPRLELCAGLLGAQLIHNVRNALTFSVPIFYWSDSKVFLSWLQLEPNKLQVFVANRISKIQTLTNINHWNYVASNDNPADIASRGIQPDKLCNLTMWWHGPPFLNTFNFSNVNKQTIIADLPELRSHSSKILLVNNYDFNLFTKYSNFNTVINIMAYPFRFINNARTNKDNRKIGHLTVSESEQSTLALIKICQALSFENEIELLQSKGSLPRNHKLGQLSPFLDKNNVLRVGGWCPQEYDEYWKVNWSETAGGHNATNTCPRIKGTVENASAYRYCELNGTWEIKYTLDGPVNYTHFDVCFIPQLQELWKMCEEIGDNTCQQVGKVTRIIEMVGLSFSLVSLVVSLFIFFSYRVLKNNRTTIHKHLFTATLLQVIFRLIRYIDMEQDPSFNFLEYWYLFEINASLLEYAKTAMFMWMFIEGLYLHNMITARVFQEYTYIKIYCYVGWTVPGIMTVVWLGIMFTRETKLTWEYYYLLDSFWILEGPRSIILIVNLLFLLNIIRVLIVKLRESQTSEIEQVRKAVRAAIFLLPLMGIAHILFFYHKFNTAWKFALWSYSAYFLITFQGFFVAVLYCFLNGEVQAAIKNSFYLYMSLRNYDYTPGRHFTLVSVLGEDGSIQNGDQPTWNQCCKPNPTTPDGKEIRFQHLNRKDTSTVITELTMVESNLRRSSSREKLSGNANEVSDTSLIQLRNTP